MNEFFKKTVFYQLIRHSSLVCDVILVCYVNVHKSIIAMNSIDTRFSRNVFEAVQTTRSTCFIGSKTTRRSRVVLNSCSFFKHYLMTFEFHFNII